MGDFILPFSTIPHASARYIAKLSQFQPNQTKPIQIKPDCVYIFIWLYCQKLHKGQHNKVKKIRGKERLTLTNTKHTIETNIHSISHSCNNKNKTATKKTIFTFVFVMLLVFSESLQSESSQIKICKTMKRKNTPK